MLKKVAGKLLGNKSKDVSHVTVPVEKLSVKAVSVKETEKNLTTLEVTVVAVLITCLLGLSQGMRIELGNQKEVD